MLGRKQSIKQDTILADYGNEELLNESADVEWVNKVENFCFYFQNTCWMLHKFFLALGSSTHEILCSCLIAVSLSQHTKDIRTISTIEVHHTLLRCFCCASLHCRNGHENFSARISEWRCKIKTYFKKKSI